jgi:hypothetical protein
MAEDPSSTENQTQLLDDASNNYDALTTPKVLCDFSSWSISYFSIFHVEHSNLYEVWICPSHTARPTESYCHCYLSRCRIQLYVRSIASSLYLVVGFFSKISISLLLLLSGNDANHRAFHHLSHQCTRTRRSCESLTNGVCISISSLDYV